MQLKHKLLVSLLAFILCLALEPAYYNVLFQRSLTIIPEIQPSADYEFWDRFTNSNDYISYIIIGLCAGFAKQKPRLLYYCILVCGGVYLKSFLKISFHQPRPFWVDSNIIPLHCKTSYGCPSGHTTIGTSLAFTLALDLTDVLLQEKNMSIGVKVFILMNAYLQAVTYTLCIAYSRIIQGVHSYNQVLFAGTLGLWLAFTLQFCVKEWLFDQVNKQLEHDEDVKEKFKRSTIVSQIGMWTLLIVAWLNEIIVTAVAPPEQLWIDNIYAACGKIVNPHYMAKNSLANTGQVNLFFGAFLALILQGKYSSYFVTEPEQQVFVKYVIRMVVDGAIFWVLYAFWQFVGLFGIDPEHQLVTWIFIDAIPAFLAGMYLFSVDYLWIRAGILANDPDHNMVRYKRDLVDSAIQRISSDIA